MGVTLVVPAAKIALFESPDVKIASQPATLADFILGSIDDRLSWDPSLKFKTLLCFALRKFRWFELFREIS